MTIRTRTFQCNAAQVTVREPIGIDRVDISIIYPKLNYDRGSERDRKRATKFADMLLRTVSIDGDMGYLWANVDSDAATTQKAFDAWVMWDDETMAIWIGELYLVAESPAEIATQPDIDPNASPLPSD